MGSTLYFDPNIYLSLIVSCFRMKMNQVLKFSCVLLYLHFFFHYPTRNPHKKFHTQPFYLDETGLFLFPFINEFFRIRPGWNTQPQFWR
jgi:hypothetical protein